MLQPADEDLIMRDPVLGSTLALLLDEEAFTAALQARLPSVTINSLRAVYVRYKPRTNCLVSYRATVDGNELDVYAKGYESSELVKAFSGPEDAVFALGGGTFSLRDTAVVVFFFPYDRELRALKRLHAYESRFREKLLRRLLPNHTHLCKGQIQTLRYKPERRFAAHLSVASDAPGALIKIYNAREFHTASRATSFHSDGPLRIAGLLGRSDRHHILAFEWLSGQSLAASLDHSTTTLNLELAGEALARLHAQSPAGLRQQRQLDGSLTQIANGLEALIPLEAGDVRFLVREISRRLANTAPQKCSIHGDFYANQVLVTDEGVALLDLDEAACGDPTSDLGNLPAHLERSALFGEINASQLEAARTALLAGYERESECTVSRDVLTAHTAAALMQLAHDPFRYRQPAWHTRTAAILDRVRELLNCGSNNQSRKSTASPRVPSKPVTGASESEIDSAMPFLQDALDPQRALPKLRECLSKYADARHVDLLGIRVTRHKPLRRCVVEYDVSLQSASGDEQRLTLVGKARARGLDESGARRLFALRRAGFDDDSPDGISVPEPFGVIPEFQMWLQRKVTGVPAGPLLTGTQGVRLAEKIGRAIHKLQQAGVVPDRQHTLKDELDMLRRCLAIVSASKPQWHGRLQRVMAACKRLTATLIHDCMLPAHRDFYHDQLVIKGDRLYLLDLDLFAVAPNALDAGNFIAHLTELGVRSTGHANALADCERTVEDSLVRFNPKISRASICAFSSLALVRHIYISTLFVDRREFTEDILELCERRLNVSRHKRRRTAAFTAVSTTSR